MNFIDINNLFIKILFIIFISSHYHYSLTNGQRLLKVAQPLPPAPPPQIITDEFSPLVTARCDRGVMYIQIVSQQPFYGVAHTRDYRKSPCMVIGDGSFNTTLKISLLAQTDDELYCGVQRFKGERSVGLAVRMHKSLELSEDRFFYLTCQNGYQNIRGGTYRVNLKLIDANTEQRAVRLIHGQPYKLRAELSPKDSVTTLRMKNCFVFTKSNDNVELIDRSGCPAITNLITPFYYNDSAIGEAYIAEMFKFPQDSKVHFQCDALLCRENCVEPDCEHTGSTNDDREYELDAYSQVSASTSVFIREPTDSDALMDANQSDLECTEWRFPWLITLCICLAIMLLVMLLLNLFMCSSLTCRCIKTDVNEKEPTDFDDYDPYRADWTAPNSLQGSRYSLQHARQQYPSDETLRSDNTSNPDYHHHDNKGFIPTTANNQPQQPKRSKRNVQQQQSISSISESDNESIDRNRYPHHHHHHHHPDFTTQQGSLRPIRTHEIDYSFDDDHHGYPNSNITNVKRY
ncbi:zona pellucida-like domain containing protein 1 [Dermatophagoides farinae]|uniref:Zona pellucida-like domain containing protein 1 n=1 Tax=Dermatophagoides farinae TaxID=6954 RepID=A0A9D4NM28_DERFA|nr:zona pellucida-like domain containing protein 1 [Dermatophagoides farinae]